MYDMKFIEMHNAIKEYLIAKHGQAFLNLSKHHQCALICETFLKYMQEQRERQAQACLSLYSKFILERQTLSLIFEAFTLSG